MSAAARATRAAAPAQPPAARLAPPPAFDLLHAPGHLLRRNHQRSYELFAQRVTNGITRQQAALLIALSQRPGASQNDLVAHTGIDKSTLKEMLGRMAKREWVQRLRHPEDSRAWALHLTQAGFHALNTIIAHVEAAQRDILAPLPPAQRPEFVRMLRVLAGLEAA